jgi:hypothetical protein
MSELEQKPQGPTFKPSLDFLARQKRLDNAMNFRKPDRVPVAPLVVRDVAVKAESRTKRVKSGFLLEFTP